MVRCWQVFAAHACPPHAYPQLYDYATPSILFSYADFFWVLDEILSFPTRDSWWRLSPTHLFFTGFCNRCAFFFSSTSASLFSWYSPICKAALRSSLGSYWSLVSASANMSSDGHHLTWRLQLLMHWRRMAKSIDTRLSSHLDTDEGDVKWSYKLLQSVTPVIEPTSSSSLHGHTDLTSPSDWICSLVLKSNFPCLASLSRSIIHSAAALAREKHCASPARVEATTLGSLKDFQMKGDHLLGWFLGKLSSTKAAM